MAALKAVWEAPDESGCSKRLKPFLPELVNIMVAPGELIVAPRMIVAVSSN